MSSQGQQRRGGRFLDADTGEPGISHDSMSKLGHLLRVLSGHYGHSAYKIRPIPEKFMRLSKDEGVEIDDRATGSGRFPRDCFRQRYSKKASMIDAHTPSR